VSVGEDWIREFRARRHLYERLCQKLHVLLEDLLSSSGISYQVVEARAKSVESFSEKIGREGKAYMHPLEELSDLAGVRIILYYIDDVKKTCDLVDTEFEVDQTKSIDKGSSLAPDQFGYLSVHKVVKVSPSRSKLPEWSSLSELQAEIQIRTVVQHSWAAISHALQYKHEAEIPQQFRRRLVRLAGLLELADQEFGALRREQVLLKEKVSESVSEGNLNLLINADTVSGFAKKSQTILRLSTLAKQAGMKGTDEDDDATGISQLTQASQLCGITTVSDLENVLSSASPDAPKFFSEFMRLSTGRPVVSDAHVAALVVIGTQWAQLKIDEIAERVGWAPDYAVRARAAAQNTWGTRSLQRGTTEFDPAKKS